MCSPPRIEHELENDKNETKIAPLPALVSRTRTKPAGIRPRRHAKQLQIANNHVKCNHYRVEVDRPSARKARSVSVARARRAEEPRIRKAIVRVSKGKLEEHREAVLRAASYLFREHGFDNVTVAEVMAAAGLTHGAFYGHFASKSELAGAACRLAFEDRLDGCDSSPGLSDYLNRYLSVSHRDDVAGGCPMASFAGEIRRQDNSVQRNFAEGVSRFVQKFAEMIVKDGISMRQARALAANIVTEMVGAVSLARSVAAADRGLSLELLTSSRLGLKTKYGF